MLLDWGVYLHLPQAVQVRGSYSGSSYNMKGIQERFDQHQRAQEPGRHHTFIRDHRPEHHFGALAVFPRGVKVLMPWIRFTEGILMAFLGTVPTTGPYGLNHTQAGVELIQRIRRAAPMALPDLSQSSAALNGCWALNQSFPLRPLERLRKRSWNIPGCQRPTDCYWSRGNMFSGKVCVYLEQVVDDVRSEKALF